jgi:hypothetical protein
VFCPVLQELVKEVPGLFSLGPKGQLVVGEARQHEQQLEKVSCCVILRAAGIGVVEAMRPLILTKRVLGA